MQELGSSPPAGIPPLPPPSIPTTSYSGFVPVSLATSNSLTRKEDETSSVASCNSGSNSEQKVNIEEKIEPN